MRHGRRPADSLIARTPSEPSPEELKRWMALIAEGDGAALESLFRATYPRLHAIARSYVRSAADAEDVVEELFLKLWTHRARIRAVGSVKSYLAVAVRNTALNSLARQRTEAKYAGALGRESGLGGGTTEDLDEPLISPEVMTQVQRAIDALPARARETYCLYYHRRLSYAEIAQQMGVSVRTVEAQLVRCVRKLTQQLEGVLE
jgi:RNA polymerase sigma-70 factor (ECF subfamily)